MSQLNNNLDFQLQLRQSEVDSEPDSVSIGIYQTYHHLLSQSIKLSAPKRIILVTVK